MKPTKADIFLLCAILLAALAVSVLLFFFVPQGNVAVVTVNGLEQARLPLDEDTELAVADGYTVVVENGHAYMKTAPCPDLICVHTPPVSHVGETVVCLPGKVIITVEEDSHAP